MKIFTQKQAVASIEVAILILPFFLLIFCLIEAFLYAYKISVLDYILDNSAKISVTKKDDIEDEFSKIIKKQFDKFGLESTNAKTEIRFCNSIKNYLDDECDEELDEQTKLVAFELDYKYSPIFLSLRNFLDFDEHIDKKAIYVKE